MTRQTSRYLFFFLAIFLGITAGLIFGWVIVPAPHAHTSPHSLRQDYKTDFALMIARLYHSEDNLILALSRLSFISSAPPLVFLNDAITYAQSARYDLADIDLMWSLATDIQIALDVVE